MGTAYSGYPYEQIVPEGGRSFLLTTAIHKLGWLPFLLLMAATALLVVWLLRRGMRLKDPMGRAMVLAVAASVGLEAAMAAVEAAGETANPPDSTQRVTVKATRWSMMRCRWSCPRSRCRY